MDAKRKTIFTVLMVLVFLLPFLSMQNFSLSTDELTHIPSGYSYWKTGEIKLNPQHPPFVKLWATLPLLFLNPSFDKNDPLIAGAKPDEWQFGRKFLFLSGNDADKIILVQDNLNTHNPSSFYELFDAPEAFALSERFEMAYTPKKASWLNMAEIELSALSKQCLDRRIAQRRILTKEVLTWSAKRNRLQTKITWQFTKNKAREKNGRFYSIIHN